MELPVVDDYQRLICEELPLLDVRAPVEFSQGAFPCAQNIALLNDDERKQIGIRYKEKGHDAAVELGANLIQGDTKAARIAKWAAYIEQNPDAVLYCFRGGMRSQITQQWIYEVTGKVVPRVQGGYKALRRFLIDQTDALAAQTEALILSGRTGSGKTLLLKQLSHAIDLEGLANHRGSSIGRQISPQPTQIDFENRVAIELMKLHQRGITQIIFEDESPNIGSVHIPHALYDKMKEAACVILDTPLAARIDITLQEYVTDMLAQYVMHEGEQQKGFMQFSEYLRNSLARVKRRLGGQRHREVLDSLNVALLRQARTGSTAEHRQWLSRMLVEYYDPMYDYQRNKRQRDVKATAEFKTIIKYLHNYQ